MRAVAVPTPTLEPEPSHRQPPASYRLVVTNWRELRPTWAMVLTGDLTVHLPEMDMLVEAVRIIVFTNGSVTTRMPRRLLDPSRPDKAAVHFGSIESHRAFSESVWAALQSAHPSLKNRLPLAFAGQSASAALSTTPTARAVP